MYQRARQWKRLTMAAISALTAMGPAVAWGTTADSSMSDATLSPTQTLKGTVSPLITSGKAKLVSPVSPTQEMTLAFVLKPRNLTSLSNIVATGKNVTPSQYAAEFAPTQQMQHTVASFLTQHDFTILSSNQDLLLVKAPASTVETTLHVSLNNYIANKKKFFSAANDPTLPTTVAQNLVSIVGLNEVNFSSGPVKKFATSGPPSVTATPDAVRTAYGFTVAYGNHITGAGQNIAILMSGDFDQSDIQSFSQTFGLPYDSTKIQKVQVIPGESSSDPLDPMYPPEEPESTLDVEWAHAIAPEATITEYETGDLSEPDLLAGMDAAIAANPTVINMSFGAPENLMTDGDIASWHTAFLEAVAQGITPVAASGDTGAYAPFDFFQDVTVNYPASDPLVLAVGGTALYLRDDNTRNSETAWDGTVENNESSWTPGDTIGSGGGYSTVFTDPQLSATLPQNNSHMRAVPDVSMVSENLMAMVGGQDLFADGTSFAAPIWCGLIALAAQKANHAFGDIRPSIYSIAKNSATSTLFNDITSGGNGVYTAGEGYDPVTGWGSPSNAWDLIQALAGQSNNQGPSTDTPNIDGIVVAGMSANTNQAIFKGTGQATIVGSGFGDAGTVSLNDSQGTSYPVPVTSWSSSKITIDTDGLFSGQGHPTAAGSYTLTVSSGTNVSAPFPVQLTEYVEVQDDGPAVVGGTQTLTVSVNQPDGTTDTSYQGSGLLYVMPPSPMANVTVKQGTSTLTSDQTGAYTVQFTNGQAAVQVQSDTAGQFTYYATTQSVQECIADTTATFNAGSGDHLVLFANANPSYEPVNGWDDLTIELVDANGNLVDSTDAHAADTIGLTITGQSSDATLSVEDSNGNAIPFATPVSVPLNNGVADIKISDSQAESLTVSAADVTNGNIAGSNSVTLNFTNASGIKVTPGSATPISASTSPTDLQWQHLTITSVAADGSTIAPFSGDAELFVLPQGTAQDIEVQQQLNGSWTTLNPNPDGSYPIDLSSGTAQLQVAVVVSGAQTSTTSVEYDAFLDTADLNAQDWATGTFLSGPVTKFMSEPVLEHMATSSSANPQYDRIDIVPLDVQQNVTTSSDKVTITEAAGGPTVQLAVQGANGLQPLTPVNGKWTIDLNNTNAIFVTSQQTGVVTLHFADTTNPSLSIPDASVDFVNSVAIDLRAGARTPVQAGKTQTVTVSVVDQNGQPVVNNTDKIALKISNVTGTITVTDASGNPIQADGEGRYIVPAAAGVATFKITDSRTDNLTYSFTDITEPAVVQLSGLVFSSPNIAPTGSLYAGQTKTVSVKAVDPTGQPIPNATVYLSFTRASGGGTAKVGTTMLTSAPQQFITDSNGQVTMTYTAPVTLPNGGTDTIRVQDTPLNPALTSAATYTFATQQPLPGGSGDSSTGSTGGVSSGDNNGSGNEMGSGGGSTSAFGNTIATQTFNSTGGTIQQSIDGNQVTLVVPANAFSTNETVKLTTTSPSQVASLVPAGSTPILALGVTFSGPEPTVPITLTIRNPAIPAGAKVYKIGSNGKLAPVQATVVSGKAVISFSTDPDFVIVAPTSTGKGTGSVTLKKNQRGIVFNGKTTVVPAVVRNGTTYMPIWYVMQLLTSVGVHSTWNGKQWAMTTKTMPINWSNLHPGHGPLYITLNGRVVQYMPGLTALDEFSGGKTTYVPIYYVMQVLNRLGIHSTWDGTYWTLTKR